MEAAAVVPTALERLDDALDHHRFRVERRLAPPAQLIRGRGREMWNVIAELRRGVEREFLGIDDTSWLVENDVPERIRLRGPATLRAALRRGAAVRQVTSRRGLAADRATGAIVHQEGGQARLLDQVPFKVSILDRRLAVMAVDRTVLAHGFAIISDRLLVDALVTVHRDLWRRGARIDDESGQLPPHLSPVLPLLAAGETDLVACRKLGISDRSYSRRVRELLTFLGVRSRFQAGVEAHRRGLL